MRREDAHVPQNGTQLPRLDLPDQTDELAPILLAKGGVDPVTAVRLPKALSDAVDSWAANQDDEPVRSEAIRRLVELGLSVKTKSAPSERQRAALADLASKAIDSLTVGTADSDEKASRKRRLLKGPEEFREVRTDRPKAKGK